MCVTQCEFVGEFAGDSTCDQLGAYRAPTAVPDALLAWNLGKHWMVADYVNNPLTLRLILGVDRLVFLDIHDILVPADCFQHLNAASRSFDL